MSWLACFVLPHPLHVLSIGRALDGGLFLAFQYSEQFPAEVVSQGVSRLLVDLSVVSRLTSLPNLTFNVVSMRASANRRKWWLLLIRPAMSCPEIMSSAYNICRPQSGVFTKGGLTSESCKKMSYWFTLFLTYTLKCLPIYFLMKASDCNWFDVI